MTLPIVKARGAKGGSLPDSESINKCMATSTTPEAAEYLSTRFESIVKDAKMMGDAVIQKIVEAVRSFASFVMSRDAGDAWGGQEPPSAFQSFQNYLASAAAALVNEKQIVLDFAVSDLSELLRGYSEGGKPLDGEALAAMDKLFSAWLASKSLISQDGVIYEGTKEGKLKQDGEGRAIKARAQALRELIISKTEGFEQYIQKNNKSVQITIRQQDFPAAKAAPEGEATPAA